YAAGPRHPGVERERAVELVANARQDGAILLPGVGVPGGHHAAPAELREGDDGVADGEEPALPVALGEALDAADEEVRAQAAQVDGERRHRAVGEDGERQHVEATGPLDWRKRHDGVTRACDAA